MFSPDIVLTLDFHTEPGYFPIFISYLNLFSRPVALKAKNFSNDIFITNNILSLDTPALFRYTFARDRGWMITTGLNISYAFKSTLTLVEGNSRRNIEAVDPINTVTFGWIGDLGYSIPFLNQSLTVSARFIKGLSAQFENSDGLKNNIFSLSIGFEF